MLAECRRDTEYNKTINSADISFGDGVLLVSASYLLGQYAGGRVSGADIFLLMKMIAEKEGYICYYLGVGPGGYKKVVANLKR